MTTSAFDRLSQGFVPEEIVGDRLHKSLRVTGIGVQEMAEQLGVGRDTVGRWISGRNAPKRPALMAWASITGVSLDWLENGESPDAQKRRGPQMLPRLDSNQQPAD